MSWLGFAKSARNVCFFGVVAVMRLTSIAAFGHDEDKG